MASAVKTHPAFAVAGAAEPNDDLRRRFAADHEVETHTDVAGLVARDDIDAVYVATPHQFHREHAQLAAEHGKHVIVEKPMALSLADCDAMIRAAEDNGVSLIVGHTHGYDPSIAAMRRLMDEELGEPAMVAALNYTNFLYRPRRPEELDTAKGGGVLFNQIPHQIDAICMLVRRPVKSVVASAAVLDPARPTEGACNALLTFENGASASLVYSGYDGFDSDELYGWVGEGGNPKTPAHGSARRSLAALGGGDAECEARRTRFGYGSALSAGRPAHQPHFGLIVATCPGGEVRPSPDGLTVYTRDGARDLAVAPDAWRPGWGDVLETLRRAVIDGVAPVQDGAFARHTVEICLAILRSASIGREVRLGDGS